MSETLEKKLTICMATYDDLEGVFFTTVALRQFHGFRGPIIVVDNNPSGKEGGNLYRLCQTIGATYIPRETPVGTSPARQAAIEAVTTDWFMCVDSHVLLLPGTLEALAEFIEANPESKDLIHGVICTETGVPMASDFRDQWRAGMWGVWNLDPRASGEEPFEIGACGLGMFAMRQKAWPGFNQNFRGFGGEEWYIHIKTRNAGGKVLCHPKMRYIHFFGRVGQPYSNIWEDRIVNYIIGHQELGLSLARIKRHFVEGLNEPPFEGGNERFHSIINEETWEHMVSTWQRTSIRKSNSQRGCCGQASEEAPTEGLTLSDYYARQEEQHPDIREHLPVIKTLSAERVCAAIGTARGAVVAAMLLGGAERVYMFDVAMAAHLKSLFEATGKASFEYQEPIAAPQRYASVQFAFLDHRHTVEWTYKTLVALASGKCEFVAIHDTEIFGERSDENIGGKPVPGILPALRRFLTENPEWTVMKHYRNMFGLTIITRSPAHKPKLPGIARQVFNFAKAVTKHLADGGHSVPEEVLEKRLDICAMCEHRNDNRCSICGCFLFDPPSGMSGKAEWAEQSCPLGMWGPYSDKADQKQDEPQSGQ